MRWLILVRQPDGWTIDGGELLLATLIWQITGTQAGRRKSTRNVLGSYAAELLLPRCVR